MVVDRRARLEVLGPAERIIEALLKYTDHMVHNRPGMVCQDASAACGVLWYPVVWRAKGQEKVVYQLIKRNKRSVRERVGTLGADGLIRAEGRVVGRYQAPGLLPEVAAWVYEQIAAVYRLDQEFAAKWASWSFGQEHRDLKVALAALMLVQERCGEPVREGGAVLFLDDDYREVGEAMCLLRRKDGRDLNPKLLLRVGELLALPQVAEINRGLGFGRSGRRAPLGRWPKAVERWLRQRERNPKMLAGLLRAGFRRTVMALAQKVHYKPMSAQFFEILRWKQTQAEDGRRSLAIGQAVAPVEGWEGLSEAEICARIMAERPGFKRLVGQLPASLGLTRAIMAAAMEAGSVSNSDLVILTPTLEELGLLELAPLRARWQAAVDAAQDQRAAHIAARVKGAAVAEALQEGADKAVKKAVAEAMRGLRVYVMVDKSGSMEGAIERAKGCLAKFVQGFPLERVHVSVFNTAGREVVIKHASAAGVEQAFRGHSAGGGTDYGAGVQALMHHRPSEEEDTLFFFVGDQQAPGFAATGEALGAAAGGVRDADGGVGPRRGALRRGDGAGAGDPLLRRRGGDLRGPLRGHPRAAAPDRLDPGRARGRPAQALAAGGDPPDRAPQEARLGGLSGPLPRPPLPRPGFPPRPPPPRCGGGRRPSGRLRLPVRAPCLCA
jgi:hypothetical protein